MAEEKNFEQRIKQILKLRGAWFLKTHGNGYQRSGIPDLIVCYKGRFIGIELKAEKGKTSRLQEFEIEEIRKADGIGMILKPSKIGEFLKVLEELDKL